MISFGKSVKDNTTSLIKIDVEKIYRATINPKEETKQKISILRNILTIDANKYRQMKTQLPYICCAIFNPPQRKTINFAYTQFFILDIDHLIAKQININELKEKLKQDKRIFFMFNSPSNDGLKIMFKLKEKCYDAGKYSLFYKLFAQKFSNQYNLEQVVDTKTSDVTRACFVSYDPAAYFNPGADNVDINSYINFDDNQEVDELNFMFNKQEKEIAKKEKQENTEKNEIPEDVFAEIKAKLSNKKTKEKPEKIIYVPEELNQILDKVENELNMYGVEIQEIRNIHYGKKLSLLHKKQKAEINIFYGHRGYTVVKTPKRGTNPELNELCVQILDGFFNDLNL